MYFLSLHVPAIWLSSLLSSCNRSFGGCQEPLPRVFSPLSPSTLGIGESAFRFPPPPFPSMLLSFLALCLGAFPLLNLSSLFMAPYTQDALGTSLLMTVKCHLCGSQFLCGFHPQNFSCPSDTSKCMSHLFSSDCLLSPFPFSSWH